MTRGNQHETRTGCRGPACLGPCEVPLALAGKKTPLTTLKRGDLIDLRWPRNNHAAGFIRIAWSPLAQSEQHQSFDQNVQFITCHEMTCKGSGDPMGPDSDGDAEGKCTTSVRVPAQLPDGNFTLQWTWYGGAFKLGDYFSCVDYVIQGGAPYTSGPIKPSFKGGDVHNPGQNKCRFFNTNAPHLCTNEPCENGNMPGQHDGAPQGFDGDKKPELVPKVINVPETATPATHEHQHNQKGAKTPMLAQNGSVEQKSTLVMDSDQSSNKTIQVQTPAGAPVSGTQGQRDLSLEVANNGTLFALFRVTFEAGNDFGAVLRLVNKDLKPLPLWQVTLSFANREEITQVYGATLKAGPQRGQFYIRSNTALDRTVDVGLLGKRSSQK